MRLAGRAISVYVAVIVALIAAGFLYQVAGVGGVVGLGVVLAGVAAALVLHSRC